MNILNDKSKFTSEEVVADDVYILPDKKILDNNNEFKVDNKHIPLLNEPVNIFELN